jgi:predicted HTH transcriptional regulator
MTNTVIQIIEYQSESYKVDFKMEQYILGRNPKKNELLKDICAFANQLSDEEKFIIVGVKENDTLNKEILDIGTPIDDANYQQFVLENIEPKITFEYKVMVYKDKTIGYFRIFNNKQRPYLFKKDVINPATNKPDFKYGDGHIRVGTTSKKIGRKEIEDIQRSQTSRFDRRNDLTIIPIVVNSTDEELSSLNIKCLDIKIINNANKSIDFDVEMTLFKGNGYALVSEFDFKKELAGIGRKNSIIPEINFKLIQAKSFDFDISESDTELKIIRNPVRSRTAITLAQNSFEPDVFGQNIILLQDKSNLIRAEIVIRSDDFIEGALKKEICFET